ncbi:MAG: hypothetical protein ACRC77_09650 [Bacteroidales bacterium]
MYKYIFSLIIFYIFSFSSCTDENEFKQNNTLPDAPEGFVNIEFDLNSGAFHKPETKAIRSDADFDAPWVLSFKLQNQDSPNPDTLFVEAVKTEIAGNKYFMQLSGSKEPHLLYFVANADKVIENKKSLFPTKKFGQVMSLLTFGNPSPDANFGLGPLSNPQGSVPFTNQNIPMTATTQLDQIVKGTKVTGTVNLQRIVSKIYMNATKTNQKDGFVLTGLTVIDVPSRGYMNNKIDIRSVQPQDIIDYGRKTGADRLTTLVLENIEGNTTLSSSTDRPIYVYPFLENDSRGGVYQVIFAGHFGDNRIKYFKIKLGGLNNPVALNKPNTSFLINIESIQNNGYVSLEHALQYEPSTGVVTKVTLLDQSHEIVANGQYYMGLTNSSYELYSNEYENIKIATVTTNAFNNGTVSPNTKVELLSGAEGVQLVSETTISSNSSDIIVNFTRKTAAATLKVTIGDLTKEITVSKNPPIESNYDNTGFLIAENVLRAKITGEITEYIDYAGMAVSDNSSDRLTEINVSNIQSPGEKIYLFYRREFGPQNFKIAITQSAGNTKVIECRQALPYFAGSNIYWDPVKQKLSFDDTPSKGSRAPHDGYIGIHFKLGSIVGVGGAGNSVRFVFNPLNAKYKSYTDVPMVKLTGNPEGSEFSNSDDLLSISNLSGFNAALGDVCRFMTARGWAPNTSKWKMPTIAELRSLESFPTKSYGDFSEETVTDDNGQYITSSGRIFENLRYPMSGERAFGSIRYAGKAAYLPTTSAEVKASLAWVISLSNTAFSIRTEGAGYGRTVRCVKDDSPGAVVPLYKIEYDLNETDAGSVTIPSGNQLLNKFVNKGGSVTLSNVELQSSIGKVHSGWLIDNTYYPLGATIPNIQSDLTAKAVWGFIAGSNIYYDGSKLTFDDVPVGQRSPNEHKQGVLFKFGSLIAIGPSSHNEAWSPYPPDYPLNSKVMDVTATTPTWENMTYSGITEVTIPAGLNTGGDPYLLRVHNVANKVGDICKYLTDKGWAPGAAQGVKWRMPTYPEVKGQTYVYEGTNWTPLVLDNPGKMYDGNYEFESGVYLPTSNVFYPTSGSRKLSTMNNPRYYGDYWLSSIEAKSACAFYFKNQVQLFNWTAPDHAALSVRCIRDIVIQ